MDSKGVQAGIIIAVVCIQAIHIASASKTLDYLHFVDDASGISYTAWNSVTKTYSYQLGYAVFVAGATAILYGILLVVKLVGISLSAKIQEILFGAAGVLQFSLGVVLAITQSRLVDPNGKNATLAEKLDVYKTMFSTQLADVVLIWIICVPGSYLLAHIHSQPTAEPAKAQTSELGLRQ